MSSPGTINTPYQDRASLLMTMMDDLPKLTTATFIGIMVAITGNILISLALNLQKLAHKRVEIRKRQRRDEQNGKYTNGNGPRNDLDPRRSEGPSLDENDEDRFQLHTPQSSAQESINIPAETHSIIPFPNVPTPRNYGTGSPDHATPRTPPRVTTKKRTLASRIFPFRFSSEQPQNEDTHQQTPLLHVDVMSEDAALNPQPVQQKPNPDTDILEEGNETEYLKSKLWWLGFLLMNVGEMGNFISYAWAPASVVAPLGTFALMANCIFAPVMLGEHFRKRDLLGILIAIVGAVTVVLASNASDERLDPDALILAIAQTPFIVYSCIYVAGAIILATLSQGAIGRQWVFVDVGLCALFGGFTVLSTKAISTLLTMQWIDMFTKWITYPVLVVLVSTGVGQIRYLNRALMRFDSKVVIPVQFVLFTLSAIIGSAILYGDFKTAKFHQIVTFLYGCAATFLGVFIIAWAPAASTGAQGDMDNLNNPDARSPATNEETRLGLGTIGRRKHATLVLPSGASEMPILRPQHSSLSLIGLSPAQHLLLVHTPPRDVPIYQRLWNGEPDIERTGYSSGSIERRRALSWFGDDVRSSSAGTRESSIGGRLRNSTGMRVGSLDQTAAHR